MGLTFKYTGIQTYHFEFQVWESGLQVLSPNMPLRLVSQDRQGGAILGMSVHYAPQKVEVWWT